MATLNAAAVLSGSSGCFVDPTKVTLIQFLKPGSVPAAFKQVTTAPVPQVAGHPSSSVVVGIQATPRQTRKSGVPNEG